MASAKITSKGQVTIPKKLRDALGLATGDHLQFHLREDGIAEMRPEAIDLLSLCGVLKPKKRGVTLRRMAEVIRDKGANR